MDNNKIGKLQATSQALYEDVSDEQLSQVYGGGLVNQLNLSGITGGLYSGAGDEYDGAFRQLRIIASDTLDFAE